MGTNREISSEGPRLNDEEMKWFKGSPMCLQKNATASAFQASHHGNFSKSLLVYPDQSTDAIVYVTVIVVFYTAIILLLLGTNIRRFRRKRDNKRKKRKRKCKKRDLVVRVDSSTGICQTTSSYQDCDLDYTTSV